MSLFRNQLIQKAQSGSDNPYLNMPITLQTLEAGNTISFNQYSDDPSAKVIIICFYRINEGDWNSYTIGTSINLQNIGDRISFYCTTTFLSQDDCFYFSSTKNFNAYGNVMSLVQGDGELISLKTIEHIYQFWNLFYSCKYLISVQNLQLPAILLQKGCYVSMFQSCTSLVNAPKLPATTLAESCYNCMFNSCTSLVNAPKLPATSLAQGCYNNMFNGCSSLTSAPKLPATSLAQGCYRYMFYGCTGLTTSPQLPATTLVNGCYVSMFQRCTSLENATELPATTLAQSCYYRMFYKCKKLSYINVSFTTWDVSKATYQWLYNVSTSGTFIKPSDLEEIRGTNNIPNNWDIINY